MKKTITLLLLAFTFFVNAQVTEIFVPTTYDIQQNAGATVPFYQKDGFIYCISHKTIGSAEGKIFKINQMTNAVTEIQEDNPFYFNNGMGDLPIYKGEYNEKVFFSLWQSYVMQINTSNNTLTKEYFQYGELNKVFQNYLITGYNKKNINTDVISEIGTINAEYNNQPTPVFIVATSPIVNSSFYATHQEYVPSFGTLATNKILKFTNGSSLSYNLEYIVPTNHYIRGIINGSGYDLFQIGNKLIFTETENIYPYNTILKSKDINNNQVSNLLSTTGNIPEYVKSFIFNNELYFYQNTDISFIKKTDGTTVVNTNLADANNYVYLTTSWYMPHRNFIEYQGNIYCLKGGGISNDPINFIKYDGTTVTNLTTELSDIRSAMIHNNIMYFKGGYLNGGGYYTGIFSFDGNTIRKLDLGSTISDIALMSSLYGYNNYLFFGNGQSLVKVDLNTVSSTVFASTLSTQETSKPTLKLYPNPTKSQLNFSEELSEIKIVDMSGKQVSVQKEKSKTINVEKLPKGNYVISAKNKNGKTVSEKFIKE